MLKCARSVTVVAVRQFRRRSSVPRVVDDPEAKMHAITDTGYHYCYHRPGVDPLPRLEGCRVPVHRPRYRIREPWDEAQARFGENDYIDLLGDGSLHPAQLQYHVPAWLRGFPGQKRANELVKLTHYRNLYGQKMRLGAPRGWHELNKRLKFLLVKHNYDRQDELRAERNLGLWDEKPDYFFKDKSRRSYQDLV